MLITPKLQPVADRFFEQVDHQPYGGAALCIFQDGQPILDIWAGESKPGKKWERDTSQVIFSTTKGLLTILFMRAVERGQIDINERVSKYWPEFGCNGKEDITVKMILRHRAGLNTTEETMTLDDILALAPVEDAFARQAPIYQPDSGFVYHALSIGHLLGKILYNVTGQRVRELIQEEISLPLGVSAWIGVPRDAKLDMAILKSDQPIVKPAIKPDTKEYWEDRAMGYGGAMGWLLDAENGGWNDPRIYQAEIAGAGGVTNARAIAKIYSAAAVETDGVKLLKDSTISEAIAHPNPGDNIFGDPQPHPIHSLGFIVANQQHCPALSNTTFGHNGLGGQQGFGDLDTRIGFGYTTNWVPVVADGMLRHRELTRILMDCL